MKLLFLTLFIGLCNHSFVQSKACKSESGDINVLNGIPRRNLGFNKVPSDFGDLEVAFFLCENDTSSVCSIGDDLDFEDVLTKNGDERDNSWVSYFQSVLMYSYIAVAFTVIGVLSGIVALIVSCTCCKNNEERAYPRWQILTTYFCLVVFIVLMFTFTMLGIIRGSGGFKTAQLAVIDAPNSLAEISGVAAEPAVALFTNVVGETTPNFLRTLNETISSKIDLKKTHEAFLAAKNVLDQVKDSTTRNNIVSDLNEFTTRIKNLPTTSSIDTQVDGILSDVTNLFKSVDDIKVFLDDYITTLQSVDSTSIVAAAGKVDSDSSLLSTRIGDVQQRLGAYKTLQVAVGNMDTALAPLTPVNTPYTIDNLRTFNEEFDALEKAIGALPDHDKLVSDLRVINTDMPDEINKIKTAFDATETELGKMKTKIDQLPKLSELKTMLEDMDRDLDAFSTTQIQTRMDNLVLPYKDIPPVKPLLDSVKELVDLSTHFNQMQQLLDVIQTINTDLVQLPKGIDVLFDQFKGFKVDIETIIGKVDKFYADIEGYDIDNLENKLNTGSVELERYLDEANTYISLAKSNIASLLGAFPVEDIQVDDLITRLQNAKAPVNGLTWSAISSGDIDKFSNLKAGLGALSNGVTARSSRVTSRVSGLITATSIDNLDCLSEDQQCYTIGGPSTASFTPCSSTNDCPYPNTDFAALKVLVDASSASFATLPSGFLSNTITVLQTAASTLGGADVTCCTDFSEITSFRSQMGNTIDVVASLHAEISKVSDEGIKMKASFGSLTSNANSFLSEIDTIKNTVQEFDVKLVLPTNFQTYFDQEERVYKLLSESLNEILNNLSAPKLKAMLSSETGLAETLPYVFEQLNGIVESIAVDPNSASLLRIDDSIMKLLKTIDKARDKDNSLRKEGSIYYLEQVLSAQLGGSSTSAAKTTCDKPLVTGCLVDGGVTPYANNTYCYRDICFRNSVDYYNSASIKDFAPDELNEIVAIPVSVPVLIGVTYIVPSVLILLAILVFFNPCCGFGLACTSVCIMPFLFLVFGALAFPLLIVTADTCSGIEAVGVNAITGLQGYICNELNGTMRSNGFCEYHLNVPPIVKVIELDTPQIFKSLVDDCAGLSTANTNGGSVPVEPIQGLFDSFGAEAATIVTNELTKLLDEELPGMGLVLRPDVRDDVRGMSSELESNVKHLATDLSSTVGCKAVHGAYIGFKEVVCCEFSTALYWSFTPWYLIAFTLLLCGLPLGCCASCRLRDLHASRQQVRGFYYETREYVGLPVQGRTDLDSELCGVDGGPQDMSVYSGEKKSTSSSYLDQDRQKGCCAGFCERFNKGVADTSSEENDDGEFSFRQDDDQVSFSSGPSSAHVSMPSYEKRASGRSNLSKASIADPEFINGAV